jgi:cytochrome c peroxidase
VFNIFDAWETYAVNRDCEQEAKAAIYRGQEVFNFNEFDISHVPGLTDLSGTDVTIHGTCSTCHNTPNVGGHSVIRMMDIGTADEPNCSEGLPILQVTRISDPTQVRRICDMGRGGNGVWTDLAKFRVPPLRSLAAKGPLFHDGQAKNIKAAIKYHENRFNSISPTASGRIWKHQNPLVPLGGERPAPEHPQEQAFNPHDDTRAE